PPKTIGTPNASAKAALTARRACLRTTFAPFWRGQTGWSLLRLVLRNERPCQKLPRRREQEGRREREEGDAQRGRDDAREPVRRVVDDDVAEAAPACDRGDRRGGDHEDG